MQSNRDLAREARSLADKLGLPISGARIRKLVRRYVHETDAGVDFYGWFITYADPTGEAAVANIMGEPKPKRRGDLIQIRARPRAGKEKDL